MQLFSRKKALLALSLGALSALAACGDDVTVPVTPPPPVVLSITPPSASLNVGESATFVVQITGGSTTTPPTITSCTSGTPAVATVTLSGSSCRVTAIAAGNATITATSSTGSSVAAQVTVSSQQAAISNLTVSPTTANLSVGQTVTITPNVNRAASTINPTYAYASSAPSVATVNPTTGVITAVGPGVATITVTATGSGTGFATTNLTQAVTVNVGALPSGITSITVQPTTLSLALGQTFGFDTATVRRGIVQPAGCAPAVITFGTSAPNVATINQNTGLVTAVGSGPAVITVTATSPANAQCTAATLTQQIALNVSPAATVTIAQINQGPVLTVYVDDSASTNVTTSNGQLLNGGGAAGILTMTNPQVDQPVDITNVRDQIQIVANLSPNGQRVDSAVVFIADADGSQNGSNRRAAARQIFSNGQANAGPITLFVNTADFTVNAAAGTADVFYRNGQKVISVSVFTTSPTGQAVEIQNASNNRQTVNFNNIDGYALVYTNPTRVATNPDVTLNYYGGPGAEGTASFTIIPVFYTPGRTLASATIGLRQGLFGSIDVCSAINGAVPFSRETFTGTPIRGTINSVFGRNISGGTAATASTVGNTNIECGGYEHPQTTASNVPAVLAAIDNTNNPAPRVTFAAGYRFSASVPRPTANRLDYRGPLVPEPDIRRTGTTSTTTWATPAVTGWVNGTFNFNTTTGLSQDFGVGTTNTRAVSYFGCGIAQASAVSAPSGTGNDIPECATDLTGGYNINGTPAGFYGISTRGPYRVFFSEGDRLGNTGNGAVSQPFGVDRTAPLIRFSQASSTDTIIGPFTFQAEVIDERSGFIDAFFDNGAIERNPTDNTNLPLNTSTLGSQQHFASRGAGVITNTADRTNCINPTLANPTNVTPITDANGNAVSANPFMTAPPCPYRILPAASIGGTLSDGYRSAFAFSPNVDGLYRYQTRVYDRAGNPSDVGVRRGARDLTAPPTVTDINVPINLAATSTPAFQVTASDNVELRAQNISLGYGAAVPGGLRLRYPQVLLDARFNDLVNSPNQRDLTVPLPQPFVISLQNSGSNVPTTSTTAGANVADVQAQLFDVANAPGNSPTVSFAATAFSPTQNGFGTVNPAGSNNFTSFSVLTSTNAGFNAGPGLKAQLVSNTNVTNQQFVRVDFYRLSGGEYQYLGSVTTPAVADQGNTRFFTYVLPDANFASTPTSFETKQPGIATGDNVIAIGVRANGAGLVTQNAVIGSQLATISIPVVGLPSGVSGNVTVSCPTAGINQVITGPATFQVDPGTVCTITAGNSQPAPGTGLVFAPNSTNPQTVTAGATGTTTTLNPAISYTGGQTLNVVVNGLPAGNTQTAVTVSGPSGTFSGPASGAIAQLAPGTYSVTTPGSITIGGTTYVLQSLSSNQVQVGVNSINPGTVTATYVAAAGFSGNNALAAGGPASTTLTITGPGLPAGGVTLTGTNSGTGGGSIALQPNTTYTVTTTSVNGFAGPTPTTQTFTTGAAGTTATLGTPIQYTPLGGIQLSTQCVAGTTPPQNPPQTTTGPCPAGFTNSVTVTGPNGFTQTFASGAGTLSNLPAGTYTVTPAGDITINGVTYYTPGSFTVNVTNGGGLQIRPITFTQAGQIVVNVTGLPNNTPANIALSIQNGPTSVLTGTTVINNVRPGTVFSLVINDVVVGGVTYRATPNNYIGLTVNTGNPTVTNIQYVPVP